jgi:hypothetical protein
MFMHLVQPRVARLSTHSRRELAESISAAIPRLNAGAETVLAYAALCALWGIVLYYVLVNIQA